MPRGGRGGSARDGGEEGGGVDVVGDVREALVAEVDDGLGAEVDGGEDKQSCHHRFIGDCSPHGTCFSGQSLDAEPEQVGGSDLAPPQQDQRQRCGSLP